MLRGNARDGTSCIESHHRAGLIKSDSGPQAGQHGEGYRPTLIFSESLRRKRQGNPQLDVGIKDLEAFRNNADDFITFLIKLHVLSNHVAGSPENLFPQSAA